MTCLVFLFCFFSNFSHPDEIACGLDDFSILCVLLIKYDLAPVLSGGSWTVFAPTNNAFEIVEDTIANLDDETVLNILLFHLVDDQVLKSDDLVCGDLIEMANNKDSRTKCDDGTPTYQSGGDNIDGFEPALVQVDVMACNGVIHSVDNVMLPGGTLSS
jgi:transforming growth factor-beta-induced protein